MVVKNIMSLISTYCQRLTPTALGVRCCLNQVTILYSTRNDIIIQFEHVKVFSRNEQCALNYMYYFNCSGGMFKIMKMDVIM